MLFLYFTLKIAQVICERRFDFMANFALLYISVMEMKKSSCVTCVGPCFGCTVKVVKNSS